MLSTTFYADVLRRFENQNTVTIATGATCAYLGDERNLREFLVADETARWLRRAGHTVLFFLIDDSLDPLNFRQLRVAVNKDEKLIERYKHWCGKPIAHLPDPWGCHESYAGHFEEELLNRLHSLDCHPTLVTTARLYERGVYTPYVRQVLDRYHEVMEYLHTTFQGYSPEKLFWPLCPHCRYIHETEIVGIYNDNAHVYCRCCGETSNIHFDDIEGKLNWKLDCAVRWALFRVDAEPFTKSYMEPQAGSFYVAQGLSQQFFGGHEVYPLIYGTVKMDKKLSYTVLESLPATAFRPLLTERPASEITLSQELIMTAASRYSVLPGVTYLDFIKQLLPMWLLTPDALSASQRDLLSHGIMFGKNFLDATMRLHLPARASLEGEQPAVLKKIRGLIKHVIGLRQGNAPTWEEFNPQVKAFMDTMGSHKGPALHRLRLIAGQEQGLPATRFLFILPLDYLDLLEYVLELSLRGIAADAQQDEAQANPAAQEAAPQAAAAQEAIYVAA